MVRLHTRFSYANSNSRKEMLIRQARSRLCVDCVAAGEPGTWPVEAMQLDHLPQYVKLMNLSEIRPKAAIVEKKVFDYHKFSIAQVIEEISHCEPVCGNHHLIRTVQRRKKGYQQELAGQSTLEEHVPDVSPPRPSWMDLLLRHSPAIWDA